MDHGVHVLTPQKQRSLRLQKHAQQMPSDAPTFHTPSAAGLPSHPSLQPPPKSPLATQSIRSPGPTSPTNAPLSYMESMLLITRGAEFQKFSATSLLPASIFGPSTQKRYVFFEKDAGGMGTLFWCKPGMRTREASKSILLEHVTGLYEQGEDDTYGKHLSVEQRQRCFSIVCGPRTNEKGETIAKGRSLDLMAASTETRNTWMHCIHQILIHSGFSVSEGTAESSPPPEVPHIEKPKPLKATDTPKAAAASATGNSPSPAQAGREGSSTTSGRSSNGDDGLTDAERALKLLSSPNSVSGLLTAIPIDSPPQHGSRSGPDTTTNAAGNASADEVQQVEGITLLSSSPAASSPNSRNSPDEISTNSASLGGECSSLAGSTSSSGGDAGLLQAPTAAPTASSTPALSEATILSAEPPLAASSEGELITPPTTVTPPTSLTTAAVEPLQIDALRQSASSSSSSESVEIRSLSPASSDQLTAGLAHDPTREIMAILTVPPDIAPAAVATAQKQQQKDEATKAPLALRAQLSPSEHPTQTPTSSPMGH